MSLRNSGRICVLALVVLVLVGCTGLMPPPAPMADVAPTRPAQEFACAMVGNDTGFDLACAEPTATPEATATPVATVAPSFWYFWCDGDARCSSGQYRVYWDRDLTMLRCALPQGDKVTRIANGYSLREGEGEPLVWVVTGADAGGRPCEGWVPTTFLRASN